MEKESFNIRKAKEIFEEDGLKKCAKYIKKYFYPCEKSIHYVWTGEKFEQYSKQMLKETYLD